MATALELGPEGWKPYLEALKNRPEPVLSPEQVAERDRLIEKAREAAAMLKAKYGATRVVLFGSLAHQAWFDAASDVDLAVEGLPAGTYFTAWRDVEDIVTEQPVDFVMLEAVSESLSRAIARDGLEL